MDPVTIATPPNANANANAPFNPQPAGEDSKTNEKRAAENEGTHGDQMRPNKRVRVGGGKEAKRVAEIVLVLSSMWQMRAGDGKGPTEAERQLMAEAREKLAEMCEDLAPKDIVARDAIVGLIEDLGLNGRAKEQRLGFSGQRLSIKEKLELSKRKMEETKKFTAQPSTYTSHSLQTNFSTAPENRGASHTARMFPSDKMPKNDVTAPTASTGLPSHFGRDSSTSALARVERPQIKLDGGTHGTSSVSKLQANASANHPLASARTWSSHPQSVSSAKPTPENKALHHIPIKAEGPADMSRTAPQAVRDQSFRPFINQTAYGTVPNAHQSSQGTNIVQGQQFGNNHNEIAKIVQKILHPKLPQRPTWTPPSREYMNKAFTCQICRLTANEVESVVLCDACEKGFHLKCLHINNQKGIPRGGEWHCMSCLKLSNGKPLPPKYGRVMRSINTPKMPSNTSVLQSPSDKKVMPVDQKVSNQQKITVNGNSTGSGALASNSVELVSDPKIHNITASQCGSMIPATQGGNLVSGTKSMDHETSSGACPSNLTKPLGTVSNALPVGSSEEPTGHTQVCESFMHTEKLASEHESQHPAISSDVVGNNSAPSQPSDNSQVHHTLSGSSTDLEKLDSESKSEKLDSESKSQHPAISSETANHFSSLQPSHNSLFDRTDLANCAEVSVKSSREDNSTVNQVERVVAQPDCIGNSVISSYALHTVEWIGDVFQTVDGKQFYQSCSVGGITYKVQDHVLLHSSNNKLMPSKLQMMWEDIGTGSKWVMVNRCFIPGDLPEAVGCPCAPGNNELYASNNETSVLAGLIRGPCKVLPPGKFKEENERLNQLGDEANNGRHPVFLCQWFYDEIKGVFRPISG